MSLFTVAGVSNNKGKIKVRFCSDYVLRVKNLQKQGDTDINLIELPIPMTKVDACNYLLEREEFTPFVADIIEVLGKKELISTPRQPIIEVVKEEVIDKEVEELRELAVA
ncbi:MAG: hypothetical protein ACO294_10235 [Methylococcales bacterium]